MIVNFYFITMPSFSTAVKTCLRNILSAMLRRRLAATLRCLLFMTASPILLFKLFLQQSAKTFAAAKFSFSVK